MGAELGTQSMTCMPESHEDWEAMDSFACPELSHSGPNGSSTVVIFDWDDTLLCSTAVRTNQFGSIEQLQVLQAAIETILRTAMGLGETLIVTNGNKTWVRDSAQRFLPGLLPLLSKIRVVSARALYEEKYPGDPFMWKRAAFERLLSRERYSLGLNLVALGDQFPEIDAARHVTHLIGGGSLVKTVKFQEAPSVSELLGQLSRADQVLGEIVDATESQDYGLVLKDLPPFLGQIGASPACWQCMTEEEWRHDCADHHFGMKDMVALVM